MVDPDFFAGARAYDRFMGRFSEPLAARFVDELDVPRGASALDVGCGPGALTAVLAERLGADRVAAVDPSAPFVEAVRARLPGVEVQRAAAGALPYADDRFDLTAAQLVVHFMPDPVAGIREMARVTRPGGQVAANVWDFGGGRGPLGVFERATLDLDADAPRERELPVATEGALDEVFAAAGIADVRAVPLTVTVGFTTFEEWWEPFTLGIGPAGAYVASLAQDDAARLRDHARAMIPSIPFVIDATAWSVIGTVRLA